MKWEQTTQYDIGLDVGLLNNRLSLTVDAYYKETTDLLVFVPVPTISGFSSALLNIGGMENRGIDLAIDGNWLQTEDFSWSTNFNYSVYRNKVLAISPAADEFTAASPSERGEYRSLVKVGEPIGVFQGFQTDGIFQSESEIDSSPSLDGALPGDIKFVDINNDGEINNDDRVPIGNPHPDYTFGITNEFRYKFVDLSILFSGSIGNDVLNTTSFHLKDPQQLRTNKYAALLDSWTPENTDARYPRAGSDLTGGFIANDIMAIEDGSFVRLQNITLGVNLPSGFLKFARSLQLYVMGQNLITWTDYMGISPEVNSAGQSTANLGADTGGYPLASNLYFRHQSRSIISKRKIL